MDPVTHPSFRRAATVARWAVWLLAAVLLIVMGLFVAQMINGGKQSSPAALALAQRQDQLVANESEAAVALFLKDLPRHVQNLTYYNADGTVRQKPNDKIGESYRADDELAAVKFYQQLGDFSALSGSGFSRTDAFDLHTINLSRTATFQNGGTAVLRIEVRSGGASGHPEVTLYQDLVQNRPIWCVRVLHPRLEAR